MDKDKAKGYLRFLDEKFTEWYTHPEERSVIAEEIRRVANNWDSEIYLVLNANRASRLFEHEFFESDIQRAFSILKNIVGEGCPNSVIKMNNIIAVLEDYKPALDEVVKKEMKDYLLEKIHQGRLKDGRITFTDDEDFQFFSKMAGSMGVDAGELLEEIVKKVFI